MPFRPAPSTATVRAPAAPHGAAGARTVAVTTRTGAGTLALRGPMVPAHAFPPGAEHGDRARAGGAARRRRRAHGRRDDTHRRRHAGFARTHGAGACLSARRRAR